MSQGWGGGGGYGPPQGGGYGPPQGGGGYGAPPGGGGYGAPPGGGGYGPPPGGGPGAPQYGQYGPPQGAQQPNAVVHQGTGTLALDTGFFFMLWLLFFVTPKIMINGAMERRPWGKSQIQLPAGVYQVTISFPYGLMSNAGQSTLPQVQIMPGCITHVTYRAPWIVFLSGSIFQVPPRPMDQMSQYGQR